MSEDGEMVFAVEIHGDFGWYKEYIDDWRVSHVKSYDAEGNWLGTAYLDWDGDVVEFEGPKEE
jgi:hypothetical protein